MNMHQGRYVWVDGKPKHVSQLNKLSTTQVVLSMLGIAMCGVLYYLSLAL